VTFSTGAKTLGANMSTATDLTVGAGTTFNTGGFGYTLSVGGNTSITGTLTLATTGTKTFTRNVTVNSGGIWNETVVAAICFGANFTNHATSSTASTNNCVRTFSGSSKTISGTTTTTFTSVAITGTYTNTNTFTILTALSGTGGLINAATGILNLGGTSAITTLTATAVGNTVNYTGITQTILPTAYNNLTLSGTGTKTFPAGTTTVNAILSIENAANSNNVTGTLVYGGSATLQYNTSSARSTGVEWVNPFAATGGVIIANTGIISLGSPESTSNDVPLRINAFANLNTGSKLLTLGGNFINEGTLTSVSPGIAIAGSATSQTIDGFTTTGAVSMLKTAGVATFNGNVNGAGLTINGAGGTLNLGAGLTHTFTASWTRTNGTLDGGSSTLRFSKTLTVNTGTGGNFIPGTGTVEYYAAGTQAIAVLTYNNLTLSGTSAKTFPSGTTTVNGILSMEGTATTTLTGTLTFGAAATLQYKGSGLQTTGNEFTSPFSGSGGVKINNATGVTLGFAESLGANPLTIGDLVPNSIFNDGGKVLTATGTLNLTSGTFKLGTATATAFPGFTTRNIAAGTKVEYAATATQTIKGISYSNLTISGTGANSKTADADIAVDGILTLTSTNASATQGCLNMSNFTLNMGATATTTGTGDVTGIVKRTQTFIDNTPYTFGNQYTNVTFLGISGGTKPGWISCKIAIGTVPTWKTGAIQLVYSFAQDGAATDKVLTNLHFLASELNSNTAATIDFWDNNGSGSTPEEHGKSNNDLTNNWIGLSGPSVTYLAPNATLGTKEWSLGNATTTNLNIWYGYTADWGTTTNWSKGHIPLSTEDVQFTTGRDFYPTLSGAVE
ncbi:MAG: hypothetical protein WCJ61_13350, partial [Paludibacter sp.]